MTNNQDFKPNRVVKGVPTAGRFAPKVSGQGPSLAPAAPSVDSLFVENHLASAPRYEGTTPDMVEEITERLNRTRNFSDEYLEQVADEVWLMRRGVTPGEEENFSEAMDKVKGSDPESWETIMSYIQAKNDFADGFTFAPPETAMGMEGEPGRPATQTAALQSPPAAPDGVSAPVSSSDPRFQNGEVFDRVLIKGREYRRAGSADASPYDTQGIRLQASRALTDREAYTIAGILGHANREAIGGETLSPAGAAPERDSPYSFLAPIDTTKGRRQNFELFEALIPDIIANGTAVRSTDRSGPGTKGSRKIEPFGDPDLKVSLYYEV